VTESPRSAKNRNGVYDFFFASGFATSRMRVMKSCAIGLGGANTFAARLAAFALATSKNC
jgi:hypothetical protein